MRISISDVNDYIKCPLFYKLKNLDEVPMDKTVDDYFRDYFKLALYFYYFSLIEKNRKSYEAMMKRWEELWFSDEMMSLFPEATLKEKSNEAVPLMTYFFKRYEAEPTLPIAVNFRYEAIFEGKEHLHVTGDIDLIKIVGDGTRKRETQMVFFSMASRYPDQFFLKCNLGTSVASYAFRSNFKEKEDKIIIQNVRLEEDVPTLRTGNDFMRAEKIIRNVCKGIKEGVFYPAPNNIVCSSCSFKLFCLNEKSIPRGKE